MRNKMLYAAAMVMVAVLVMCGCATKSKITKLKGVWKFDQHTAGYLEQVLIVGIPLSEENRIPFEDHFLKELRKKRVDVIACHTLIPEMKDLNRANIQKAAKEAGVNAVLATRAKGIDEKEAYVPASVTYDEFVTPHGTRLVPTLNPARVEKYAKVRLETGLFEVASGKLIWAANSEIMNPKSASHAIKDFSAAIIEQLAKDGYFR